MIISRTPLRISFAGGGSDMKEFYSAHGGAVLSVAIRKYVYLSMHPFFHQDKIFLKYSESELVDSTSDIKHKIIREVFNEYGISGVDFNSSADVPAGTGLGSSSAFTVGLINLCNAYTRRAMHKFKAAEYACQIEIDKLAEPIGKQDQYAASIGGMNYLRFMPDGEVKVESLALSETVSRRLQNSLRMYYLGSSRSASAVLREQRDNIRQDSAKIASLKKITQLARDLRIAVRSGDIDAFGEIMHTGWMHKQELASGISNEKINHYYELGIKNGATGGKLLGAGGSGFLLFYVPERRQEQLRYSLRELKEYEVEFDSEGSTVIYNDQTQSRNIALAA
ncbi:MAG: GHMP kinase [Planctomycetia bacterium]|nr:GHMP kinase [Planctomycetia bacterium]